VSESNAAEAESTLSHASRAKGQTKAAGRWWAPYMAVIGAISFVFIVVVEVFLPASDARIAVAVLWGAALALLGWWGESRDVHPPKARRRMNVSIAVWLGSYVLVIGPLVRWQAGTSLAWWSLASAVMAAPFLVSAWLEWRRS
jgi:hypothetical protein